MKNMRLWLSKTSVILSALSLALGVASPLVCAAADAYPMKLVRLICGSAAGSNTDAFARVIADDLSQRLGKKVLVENHGGAGGIIGSELVARATPDGYTLLFCGGWYTINAGLRQLPFDPLKSLIPVAKFGDVTMVLVVHPSVPANSVKEFIALAKQKPGQILWAAAEVGSNGHMNAALFKALTGADFKIVNFKGSNQATIDILGGHSHAIVSSATVALPHIKSGKLRVLAQNGTKRSDILPDVPTFAESGLPEFEPVGWVGILAPAGTPQPIVDRLAKEIETGLTTDAMKKFHANQGAETAFSGPSKFGQFLVDEIAQWRQVAKKANIKLE